MSVRSTRGAAVDIYRGYRGHLWTGERRIRVAPVYSRSGASDSTRYFRPIVIAEIARLERILGWRHILVTRQRKDRERYRLRCARIRSSHFLASSRARAVEEPRLRLGDWAARNIYGGSHTSATPEGKRAVQLLWQTLKSVLEVRRSAQPGPNIDRAIGT